VIECVFTVDYEIYGNGEGSLKDLVFEPARQLSKIFKEKDLRCVIFVEAAELEIIGKQGSDEAISLVEDQIRSLYNDGFELGLHLHPQWYNARYEDAKWFLDYGEYNLCTLSFERTGEIIDRSIDYLRHVLGEPAVTPLSFRAGNWLLQPSKGVVSALAERGVKIDSSVFKGGLQHRHKLDYRRALKNGGYWRFGDNVNVPDSHGVMTELPIHTQMVPFWRMLTGKRIGLQRQGASPIGKGTGRLDRFRDLLRFHYPLKFDFCRMTVEELTRMMDRAIKKDRESREQYWPMVAIGHTKDLVDFRTVETFLLYLQDKGIPVSTFEKVCTRIASGPVA
jgi:hypothetical protein